MKLYQQGDVLMFVIDEIPKTAKGKKNRILAEGESTGHYHEANGGGVVVLEDGKDLYLDAPDGCEVNHQEHRTVVLPAGKFKVGIVQEYDHFAEEARNVKD